MKHDGLDYVYCCGDCRHYNGIMSTGEDECEEKGEIVSSDELPYWCPLPDYKED